MSIKFQALVYVCKLAKKQHQVVLDFSEYEHRMITDEIIVTDDHFDEKYTTTIKGSKVGEIFFVSNLTYKREKK